MCKFWSLDKIVLLLVLTLTLSLVACGGNGSTGTSATPTSITTTNEAGTGPKGLPLYCPLSVAINRQDMLSISDNDPNMNHERIINLSTTGQELSEWHIFPPDRLGVTQGPGSAAFDAQGNMYVIDLGNDKVVKVSPDGKVLTSWGSYGSGQGQFEQPEAVAVDSQGTIYVGDSSADSARIEKFSESGIFLGTVMPQLKAGPIGLAVDSNDHLYVANDTSITELSTTGQVLVQEHLMGSTPASTEVWEGGISTNARRDFYAVSLTVPRFSQGSYPHIIKIDLATGKSLAVWNVWKAGITKIESIAVDSQGNVYATETTKTRKTQLQKFSSTGAVLATWQGTCSSS